MSPLPRHDLRPAEPFHAPPVVGNRERRSTRGGGGLRVAAGAALTLVAVRVCSTEGGADTLTSEIEAALRSSPYVYIATQRKHGGFGTPAEIWFMYRDGAVWVVTPPTTWRAKRIRAGRPAAHIAVGRRDGPTFDATGSFVKDPAMYAAVLETYAKKYPDGWQKWEERFRSGLADGSRVLIKYQPR